MGHKSARRRRGKGKAKEPHDIFADKRLKSTRARIADLHRGNSELAKTADALDACGCWPAALKLTPNACEAVYRNQCRERMCPVCATLKGARHRAALSGVVDERLAAGARFTLMTLTFPHSALDGLKDLLRILFKAVALFRKTAFFTKSFHGWARGIEVTWSVESGFHPHAHFLVEAGFIRLDTLHAVWLKCVVKAGGRPPSREGIDLKGLTEGTGLNEAIGYPFKVSGLAEWPDARVIELAEATKRRHLYQTCRKWSRRIQQREVELEALQLSDSGSEVVRFHDFVDDVRQGDEQAQGVAPSVLHMLAAADGLKDAAEVLYDAMPEALRSSMSAPADAVLCHASG